MARLPGWTFWFCALLVCVLLVGALALGTRALAASSQVADVPSSSKTAAAEAAAALPPAYSLPPDKLEKAVRLGRARTLIYFGSGLWSIVFLGLLLSLGWVARLRDCAASATDRRWLQGLVFVPCLTVLISFADLPLAAAGHHLSLAYGQSIQPWRSWFRDWTKALALTVVAFTVTLSLLFALIRKSPRRWWLWFWMVAMPLQVLVVFVVPYVVDPMFNRFEPLAQSNPALVEQLERVVARSNLRIPPSRMFLMKASEKYTGLNAYVTGFGNSKRIVVWDTTIQKSAPDEILFIYGHEQGHYALNHIRDGMVASAVGSFFALWLGFHVVGWLVRQRGPAWGIADTGDWATAGVLLLVLAVFNFFGDPIANSISRVIEHHADIYGQEVIHGLVADPQRTAEQSFQRLGESSLDEPDPSPLVEFWTYSHPSISRRAAFAAHYDPWREGQRPRYFAHRTGYTQARPY